MRPLTLEKDPKMFNPNDSCFGVSKQARNV